MLLVFRWEIVMFFEHDKYFVSHTDKSLLNMDELVTKIEQNVNGKVSTVYTHDRSNDTMVYVVYVKSEDNKNLEDEHRYYLIDPYTGETLGKRFSLLTKFFSDVSDLHSSLFLPSPIGRIVVGSATLIFVAVALSGLCLWLPTNFHNVKAWKNGFFIRFRKGKKLLIHDLHKTLGFYVLIPMLLMALTGLTWSFQWYNNGVQIIFHAEPGFTHIKPLPQSPDAKRLPLEFFIKKADEIIATPNMRDWSFFIPEQDDEIVFVLTNHRGKLGLMVYDGIQFDQYTGEVLKSERFDDIPAGAKFVSLFYDLHVGNIFGLPTKIIYFLACLFATTLPITGVLIWWRKLRNLRRAKNNKITENQQKFA
jgi:uncharacterized iron-regulated membrane protein